MVAYTPILQLPYQTGGDRPCDAADVWCDLANKVDLAMFNMDQSIARLDPAIPCAKVKKTTSQVITGATQPFGASFRWDAVEFDTDNMVDLTVLPFEVKPRRAGTYQVMASMIASSTPTSVSSTSMDLFSTSVTTSPFFSSGTGAQHLDFIPTLETAVYYWRTTAVHIWDPTQAYTQFGWSMGCTPASTTVTTVTYASLAVYWVSDLI